MNIGQFILTLVASIIGTLAGGLVVIFTNGLSARRTRRKSLQDWYRKIYIAEGVDPLITFFVELEFRWKWSDQKLLPLEKLPITALANIQVLLDNHVLTEIARDIQNELTETQLRISTQVTLLRIGSTLLDLRKELLRIIPAQVNEVASQVTLPGFTEKFEKIHDELQRQINEENKNKVQ